MGAFEGPWVLTALRRTLNNIPQKGRSQQHRLNLAHLDSRSNVHCL